MSGLRKCTTSFLKLSALKRNNVTVFNTVKSFHSAKHVRNVLEQNDLIAKEENKTYVGGFGDNAILVNNVMALQSIICLPTTWLLWQPKEFKDITIESLTLFTLMYPKLDLLLIGCGENMTKPFPHEIHKHFKALGIIVEATSTSNAASTFNLLNAEGRNVAAALLTPQPWVETDDLF